MVNLSLAILIMVAHIKYGTQSLATSCDEWQCYTKAINEIEAVDGYFLVGGVTYPAPQKYSARRYTGNTELIYDITWASEQFESEANGPLSCGQSDIFQGCAHLKRTKDAECTSGRYKYSTDTRSWNFMTVTKSEEVEYFEDPVIPGTTKGRWSYPKREPEMIVTSTVLEDKYGWSQTKTLMKNDYATDYKEITKQGWFKTNNSILSLLQSREECSNYQVLTGCQGSCFATLRNVPVEVPVQVIPSKYSTRTVMVAPTQIVDINGYPIQSNTSLAWVDSQILKVTEQEGNICVQLSTGCGMATYTVIGMTKYNFRPNHRPVAVKQGKLNEISWNGPYTVMYAVVSNLETLVMQTNELALVLTPRCYPTVEKRSQSLSIYANKNCQCMAQGKEYALLMVTQQPLKLDSEIQYLYCNPYKITLSEYI